jgi:O-antigen/teichoic acid export membrane protein/tetratricopeptide (TPR) repeat protein
VAAAVVSLILILCAVGFGIWSTVTWNAGLFNRQTALAGIYSFVLAILVVAIPIGARSLRETRTVGEDASHTHRRHFVVGNIPQEPRGFQPRVDLLRKLKAPGPWRKRPVIYALTGMRGVGKTQLAAAYARAQLAKGWRLVAWINSEDQAAVLNGLADMAAVLGLAGSNGMEATSAGKAVRSWLEGDGRHCLLVFDNVANPDLLQMFIPTAGKATIMITSDRQSTAIFGAEVPVDVFTENEALSFLAERTCRYDTHGAAALAGELGCLPLALAQAAAVIETQRLDYCTFLNRLRARPAEDYLSRVEGELYPHRVATAMLLSLEGVSAADETGACSGIMDLVSVLSPAGVTRELLYTAGQTGAIAVGRQPRKHSPDIVDGALSRLVGSSLLTFNIDGSILSAHRLVIRVIREQLAREKRLTAVCKAASEMLYERTRPISLIRQNPSGSRDLVEHIVSLNDCIILCTEEIDYELTRHLIVLRQWALKCLNELRNRPQQAIAIGESLLAECEPILGPDHRQTMVCRNDLANAYLDMGQEAEAIELHRRNLADRQRVLGPDHPDTIRSRNNLAVAYQDAGRLDEAIELHRRNLADRQRVLGPDHPDTIRSRNNLAVAYNQTGRAAAARPMREKTLTDCMRVLGPDHPTTLAMLGARISNPASAEPAKGTRFISLDGKHWLSSFSISLTTPALRLMGVAAVAILARTIFGPRPFGLYLISQVVLAVLLSANELGMTVAIIRWDDDVGVFARTAFTLALTFSALLFGGLLTAAPSIAHLLGSPAATGMIRVMSLCVIIDGMSYVPLALLQRMFARRLIVVNPLRLAAQIGVTLLLSFSSHNPISLAWGTVAGSVTALVACSLAGPLVVLPGWNNVHARRLLRFGMPLIGASLVTVGILNVDSAIVAATLGPAELGLFGLACHIADWPSLGISQTLAQHFVSSFARAAHSVDLLADAYKKAVGLLMGVAVPAVVLLATLADPLIRIIYGQQWTAAAPALTLLSIFTLFRLVYQLNYNLLAAVGKASLLFSIQIWWLVSLIPALIIGIQLDGITGVAAAQIVVAGVLLCPILLWALSRIGIPVHLLLVASRWPFVGGLFMTVASELLLHSFNGSPIGLITTAAASIIVYLIVILPVLIRHRSRSVSYAPDEGYKRISSQREHDGRSKDILFLDKEVS